MENKINLNKGTLLLLVAYKKYDTPIFDVNSEIYNIKKEGYKIENDVKEDDPKNDTIKKMNVNERLDHIDENIEKVRPGNLLIEENVPSTDNIAVTKGNRSKRQTRIKRNRRKFRPSPLLSGG